MRLSEQEELEMLELENEEALAAENSAVANPRQTIGDQLSFVRQNELEARANAQADPRNQNAFNATEMARGFRAGVSGTSLQDKTVPAELGGAIGKYALPVAGSIIAGVATGGGSLLASASAQFLGVGAGQAYKQIISKSLGEKSPTTSTEATADIASHGLGAAMADLGIGAGVAVAGLGSGFLKNFAHAYFKVPSESIKRAIQRPYAIETGGPEKQLALENKAVEILSKMQDAALSKRSEVGKSVESALDNLQKKTKGAKVFDLRPLADDLETFMKEGLGSEDKMIKKLMAGDYVKIKNLIKTMRGTPMKDAKTMVRIRRELDKMQTFNFGGVPQIESEAGTLAIRRLADGFRSVIDGAADILNFGELKSANSAAHSFYQDYDNLRTLIGTKDRGRLAMIGKIDRLEALFNKGGIRQELIKEIGDKIPSVRGATDDLMDAIASRSFIRNAVGTPSGNMKDLARAVMTPQNIAKTIKAGQSLPARAAGFTVKTSAKVAGKAAGLAARLSASEKAGDLTEEK